MMKNYVLNDSLELSAGLPRLFQAGINIITERIKMQGKDRNERKINFLNVHKFKGEAYAPPLNVNDSPLLKYCDQEILVFR